MKSIFLVITLALGILSNVMAQDKPSRVTTLPEIFTMVTANSTQLRVSAYNTELSARRTDIARLGKLPNISTDFKYGYLSNADIWTPDFSKHQRGSVPDIFTQLTVQAAEVIFAGGEIRNEIKKSGLEEQIAFLSQEKNVQDMKFLAAAQYLDIYRQINLRSVYQNNARLAEERLRNILVMNRQGMVTQNDVLRTKLTLSDLLLSIRKIDNNIAILNKQLNTITGQPDSTRLVPDGTLLKNLPAVASLGPYIDTAFKENHELKISQKEIQVAETNLKIVGSDRYPSVALFAGSTLQRPFLNTIPSVDVYYNVWQVGIGIRYNISSVYQSPRKLRVGRVQLLQSRDREVLQREIVSTEVTTRYIRYKEAADELATVKNDLLSSEENYRIVEKKYYNQLALLTDLIDGTSTKLESEIRVSNAEINMVYTYLQLLKSVGTL